MQVTETTADGLRHEFTVTVAADDIERQVQSRLDDMRRRAHLPGFRPGKVPVSVLRKRYGTALMGEVLEQVVNSSTEQAIRERNLRPALQPKVEILSFKEGTDLSYKMAVEVLPEIHPMDFRELRLERLRPEVPDEEVDAALARIARQQRKVEKVERAAETGDVVVIDFVGSIGGEPFPGGKADNYSLELGSNGFIPGFEAQLVGAVAGEQRAVAVTFPADYGVGELAGKPAEFAVTVKEVRAVTPQPMDDSLAEAVGMENLEELRKTVRERIERDYAGIARQRLKRELLDKLAERHSFPVPAGMVDLEFDSIWKQFEAERERARAAGRTLEDEGKPEEDIKAEYGAIAERRVRLGLLLAEVGRSNNITVAPEELSRAVADEARRHPGQERQVMEFFRANPRAADGLRAPIFEEKVVDFIVEMAQVTERTVPLAELLAEPEEEESPLAALPATEQS
jgi:trigger factor